MFCLHICRYIFCFSSLEWCALILWWLHLDLKCYHFLMWRSIHYQMKTSPIFLYLYLPTNTSISPSLHTMVMETQVLLLSWVSLFQRKHCCTFDHVHTFFPGRYIWCCWCFCLHLISYGTGVSLQHWLTGQRVFGVSNRHRHRCNIRLYFGKGWNDSL